MSSRRIIVLSNQWATTDPVSHKLKQRGTGVDLVDFGAAANYVEAIDRYDLAVVDINEENEPVVAALRTIREYSDITLLVLTHDRDKGFHLMLYTEGADECILKPVATALLIAKIEAWLRGSQDDEGPGPNFGVNLRGIG